MAKYLGVAIGSGLIYGGYSYIRNGKDDTPRQEMPQMRALTQCNSFDISNALRKFRYGCKYVAAGAAQCCRYIRGSGALTAENERNNVEHLRLDEVTLELARVRRQLAPSQTRVAEVEKERDCALDRIRHVEVIHNSIVASLETDMEHLQTRVDCAEAGRTRWKAMYVSMSEAFRALRERCGIHFREERVDLQQ